MPASPARPGPRSRALARVAARLAAVQALYQQEMEGTPLARLLHEFHHHRLGATIDGVEYREADVDLFDDIVSGVDARRVELDARIAGKLPEDWPLENLDKSMKAIFRAGAYELAVRAELPAARIVAEYVDVARAFYDPRQTGFVHGVLDALAKDVRG